MGSKVKKAASFSIRMTAAEREYLDAIATRYDRPRSWVIRKTVEALARLEKERRSGKITEVGELALKVLEKGLKDPIRRTDLEE